MLKLNINEACKLAKTIEDWKRDLLYLLSNKDYTLITKENHLKKKSNPEAEDEVLEHEDKRIYEVQAEEIIKIISILNNEKAQLSTSIEDAKHEIKIDVDGVLMSLDPATEYNKSIRSVVYSLNNLGRFKEGITKTTGRDYALDVERKQTEYRYPVEIETTLNFNKETVKAEEKKLRQLADKVSIEIDKAKINTTIELDTKLELTDSLEDVILKLK